MKTTGADTLLAQWKPPTGAGDPVGVLCTTYTFDPTFFEEQCLARFLGIESLAGQEGLAYLLERENRLGTAYAGVMVDQQCAGVDRPSLRWDVLPVRVNGGIQHSKVSLLVWMNHIRVIVSSGNLTRTGYRTNWEVAGTLDLCPDSANHGLAGACLDFLAKVLLLVPGAGTEDPAATRAKAFLEETRKTVLGWTSDSGRNEPLKRHLLFTAPFRLDDTETGKTSALASALDIYSRVDAAPSRVWVVSPFFDAEAGSDTSTAYLCKGLSRKNRREVTLCVPVIGPLDAKPLRLAAPKSIYNTACKYCDNVTVEALPQKDDEGNMRTWHAKMLWLENEDNAALMFGSSNFTTAGMGTGERCNIEANLLFIIEIQKHGREYGLLEECWPENETVEDPDDGKLTEWTNEQAKEEAEAGQAPALPHGFVSAIYRAGKGQAIILTLDPTQLPSTWKILGGTHYETQLVDSLAHAAMANKERVEVQWTQQEPPGKLLVEWENKRAFWSLNVEDGGVLPLPTELNDMTSQELLAILGAKDVGVALGRWVAGHFGTDVDQDQDTALPAELDPLKRYDLQETFLHKIRNRARLFGRVRQNLERPVWSLRALEWRLKGLVGVQALADRMSRGLAPESGARLEEVVLELADFLLMLNEVRYVEEPGAISKGRFDRVYRLYLSGLAEDLHFRVGSCGRPLPADIQSFWDGVIEKCRS